MHRVRVIRPRKWEEAVWPGMEPFDTVFTEEISDDLLTDGLLHIARVARKRFLRPNGSMCPRRIVVWGALASVRVKQQSGFDLRQFNTFRSSAGVVYDLEEVFLNEPGAAMLLSDPIHLFSLDLNKPPEDLRRSGGTSSLEAAASADGIFNCLVTWFELEMPSGARVSFAPNWADPQHMYVRAIKQRLHFVGYERQLRAGDVVALHLAQNDTAFDVTAPADRELSKTGRLVPWTYAPLLSYHFPMIAETVRNDKFERALLRAIVEFKEEHGRGPHVLDIGSGTGLLAMMAARGGAAKVTSLEMVPAVAAVARQIVQANGYSHVVQIINARSDELPAELMGSKADILVSELVDDHVIGDGILMSHADARRRLLVPSPTIVPRSGRIFAIPIQLRYPTPAGVSMDVISSQRAEQVVLTRPYHSFKLQRCPPEHYRILADPIPLFTFDWARGDIDSLAHAREMPPKPFTFSASGTFNAFALTFDLQMDDDLSGDYSGGLDNVGCHWDQPIRFLPVELRVRKGDKLHLASRHNDNDLNWMKISGIRPEMLHGMLGARNLLEPSMRYVAERLGVVLQVGD